MWFTGVLEELSPIWSGVVCVSGDRLAGVSFAPGVADLWTSS